MAFAHQEEARQEEVHQEEEQVFTDNVAEGREEVRIKDFLTWISVGHEPGSPCSPF